MNIKLKEGTKREDRKLHVCNDYYHDFMGNCIDNERKLTLGYYHNITLLVRPLIVYVSLKTENCIQIN